MRHGLLAVILLLASTALAAPVVGRATVVDGDTLEIGGVRVRLYGIDAPESSQTCTDAKGQTYRCGAVAANRLSEWLGQRTVSCEVKDTDRYGRAVAVCSVGGQSVNAWLVENGLAVAYAEYSRDYLPAEDRAKEARLGLWAGTFQMPWEYRANPKNLPTAGTPRPAAPSAPQGGVYFRNCTEARAVGYSNIPQGSPGYHLALDRDGDGVACER